MDATSLISVVIPTYNRASDLKRALKSVQAQTFINWEVLIIDNHSDDNTDQMVCEFNDPRIKLFKIYNNGVIAASRNEGIRKASGEYIAFLDSDDWWKPEKLRLSFDALNAGADIVYHDLFLANKSDQLFFWKKVVTRDLKPPIFVNLLNNGNCINNSSVVVRKNILSSIGGLSEDYGLIAIEDYDCWLRIAKLTDKFTRIPKSLGYYWAGGGNISNPEKIIKSIDTFMLRYLDNKYLLHHGANNWIHYSRGRAYFLLRNFEMAKKNLSNIGWSGTPLRIYIKSQWMLQFIKISSKRKF
jgi:glycosyltransferase involved in cell wall biosynthesis